jgi:hypothetical protein
MIFQSAASEAGGIFAKPFFREVYYGALANMEANINKCEDFLA